MPDDRRRSGCVQRLDPIFSALAPGRGDILATPFRDGRASTAEQGYLHAGPHGAGHFVKMIHNGIEYGMMQAMAEGFDILKNANSSALPEAHRLDFDLAEIDEVWRRGSVITSWLLDLTASALAQEGDLASYSGHVADSGEGRWTIQAAIDEAVPADVLYAALSVRFRSRQTIPLRKKCCLRCAKDLAAISNRQGLSDAHRHQGHHSDGRFRRRKIRHRRAAGGAAWLDIPRCGFVSPAREYRENVGRAAAQ